MGNLAEEKVDARWERWDPVDVVVENPRVHMGGWREQEQAEVYSGKKHLSHCTITCVTLYNSMCHIIQWHVFR